jgi:Ser/Thr protein kinase RdoA (MazF antagonist)
MNFDLKAVFNNFRISGEFAKASPCGCGHINDTFAAVVHQRGHQVRYIFQRINHYVFKTPASLMDNIKRVTQHQRLKLQDHQDASRRSLTLIPSIDGAPYHQDKDGNFWRCYIFVEGASTYDIVETPQQAFLAAKAFGQFQKDLVDLPGGRLFETIPDFHNTPKRFRHLQQALEMDNCNRAAKIKHEIEFALAREAMTKELIDLNASGEIPERTTHNDTKLNNLLIDDETGEAICVIDLDTVMPGLALYDFGDLVRTVTSPVAEDELDLSKVNMQMYMYEALVKGYLSSTGEFLTPAEKSHLAFGGKLITFETGLRFLTDYLEGDVYFKTHRQAHNLDRCRTQFKLVASIEEQEEAMFKIGCAFTQAEF